MHYCISLLCFSAMPLIFPSFHFSGTLSEAIFAILYHIKDDFFFINYKKLFILSHFDNFDQNLDTLYPSFVLNNNKNKTSPGFLLLSIITYTLLHQHTLYFYWFLILFMTLLYYLYLFICLLMSATGCSDIYSAYTFLHFFFLTYLYQNLYKWT